MSNWFSHLTSTFITQPLNHFVTRTLSQPSISLNNTSEISLTALSQLDYYARKFERNRIADEILQTNNCRTFLDPKAAVTWQQFALMVCPGLIRDTSLEGGYQVESIQASLDFIRSCLEGKGLFFPVPISKEIFRDLEKALTTFDYFLKFHLPYSDKPHSDKTIEETVKTFLQEIRSTFTTQNSFYIPLGYCPGTKNQGHALALKLSQEREHIVLTLFNLGNGASLHPILNYSLQHKERSFAYYPIRIPKTIFYGECGVAAFSQVLRYLADAPLEGLSYDGFDLYDIFLQFVVFENGGEIVSFHLKSEYAEQEQIAGNCPEIAVKCVINDLLIQAGSVISLSKIGREKFFLNRDFFALLSAYKAFMEDTSCHPSARELLHEAASSIGAQVLNFYDKGQIDFKQFFAAQSVIHKIAKATTKATFLRPKKTDSPKRATTLPFDFLALPSLDKTVDSISIVQTPLSFPSIVPPRFTIRTIKTDLDVWIQTIEKLTKQDAFAYLSDCLRVLPIPLGQTGPTRAQEASMALMEKEGIHVTLFSPSKKEDVWDDVPLTDIPDIIAKLKTFVTLGLDRVTIAPHRSTLGTPLDQQFTDQFLTVYTGYAIVDKLARRLEDTTKLSRYASPFLPHPFSFVPNGFTSLPLKEDNERYSNLQKYFTDPSEKKKVIFPIAPTLPVSLFHNDLFSQNSNQERAQGKNHLDYFWQFVGIQKNVNDKVAHAAENWIELLPQEVQVLYHFVFLSHCLFASSGVQFPSKLLFRVINLSGQTALQIDTPLVPQPKLQAIHLYSKDGFPDLKESIYDTRFLENGTPNNTFIDIFSPAIQALTTNDAICYQLSEKDRRDWNISEPLIREVLYILRKPVLSFWEALSVFSHPDKRDSLTHPGVQQALDSAFFQPQFILERLEQEPETVKTAFRKFVKEGLNHFGYNISQLSTLLFLLRTGIVFESYLENDKTQVECFSFYQTTLDELKKKSVNDPDRKRIEEHLLFLEGQKVHTNETAFFGSLFSFGLWVHSSMKTLTAFSNSSFHRLIRSSAYKHHSFLKEQARRNAVCKAIIIETMGRWDIGYVQSLPNEDWVGQFPLYTSGELSINFFTGTIRHLRLSAQLYIQGYPWGHLRKSLIDEVGHLSWKLENDTRISLNEKLIWDLGKDQWADLSKDASGQFVQKPILIFGEEETKSGDQDFLSWFPKLPWVHTQEEEGIITIRDSKTGQPYLQMKRINGTVSYTRLSSNGKPLPLKLVNLALLSPSDPLYPYTARFTYPDKILCFVDTKNKIEELNFYRAQMRFVNDGKGLAASEFPGFYLIATEKDLTVKTLPDYEKLMNAINRFPLALVLYNPKANKWHVLMPCTNSLTLQKGDFSKEVDFNKERNGIEDYLSYKFDTTERCLKVIEGDSDTGNLHLALIFKMQRDYDKAAFYLNLIKPSHAGSHPFESTLKAFLRVSDSSISSLAFNVRLCLFVIQRGDLMLEQRFDPKREFYKKNKEIFEWGIENYTKYLSLLTDQGFSRASEKILLSEKDKKILLLAFRAYYEEAYSNDKKGWETLWNKHHPLLEIQYQVYFSRTSSNSFLPQPQEISLSPPIYSQIKRHRTKLHTPRELAEKYRGGVKGSLPLHPVNVTEEAIITRLPQLYEQARACQPGKLEPFDFTLQTFFKALNYNSSYFGLPDILFFVRHFSDLFQGQDYSMAGITPDQSDRLEEVLKRVFEKLSNLPNEHKDWYDHFFKVLETKVSVKINQSIELKVPPSTTHSTPLIPWTQEATPGNDLHSYQQQLEKEIRQLFDSPYKVRNGQLTTDEIEEEARFILRKDSGKALTFSNVKADKTAEIAELIMKEAILENDFGFIAKQRPVLLQSQMMRLCWCVNEWYYTRIQLQRQQGTLVAEFTPYDHQKHPEISYFYLKSGKFPRPQQLKTYLWVYEGIAEGKNRYFQLPAGQGKTDVVLILLTLAAKKLKRMAVTCVTSSIYPVDKENIHFNMREVDQQLCYLEVGMHMINKLTAANLKFIFTQLKIYRKEGKSLIITRHTYDALYLIVELGCYTSGKAGLTDPEKLALGEKIRWGQNILNFFEEECLLICDEAHQNGDPITRAIFGVGEFTSLLKEESQHLLSLIKPILGLSKTIVMTEKGEKVSEMASLADSLKVSPMEEKVKQIQIAMAKYSLAHHFTDIPEDEHETFITYWTDETAEEPAKLKTWGKENRAKANLAALTSHFLIDLLPEMLKMRTNIDHGRSLYPQHAHEVPANKKQISTAEYDDRYKTGALTIKGIFDRGLFQDDIRRLIEEMIKSRSEELQTGFTSTNSPTALKFKSWIEGASFSDLRLEDIVLTDNKQMEQLFNRLKKHTGAIEHFLHACAFVNIGSPAVQLTCTTTSFFNGFRSSVLFSATPLEPLANPRSIGPDDYLKDDDFVQNVLTQLQKEQNGRRIYLDKAPDFFDTMKKEHKELFEKGTVMIVPRGFFSWLSNEELAKEWLGHNPTLAGVLYWHEERSTQVDREEKICLLLRGDKKTHTISGSNIKTAFAELGLDWETLKIGTFFDPAHTESANILQKPDAVAFFFPWEELTTSHMIQALMRMRGFLNAQQTIVWIYQKDLANKIFRGPDHSRALFIEWTDKNEREQSEKRVILNAFQELHFHISQRARNEIVKAHLATQSAAMEAVVSAYQKYRDGLVETLPKEPYDAFGQHETLQKTEAVLLAFAKELYKRFNYPIPFEDNIELKQTVEQIISDVKERVSEMYANGLKTGSKQIEQHTQLQLKSNVEREQQNQVPRPIVPLALPGNYGNMSIYHPNFLNAGRTPVQKLFKSDLLTPALSFTQNQILTAKLKDSEEASCPVIKPVHFFTILVIDEQSQYRHVAWAESHEILDTHLKDLVNGPEKVEGLKHCAFIVSSTGQLVQKGLRALAPPPKQVEEILASNWMVCLTMDAALFEGRIERPEKWLSRIKENGKGWPGFETLWNTILDALPNREVAHLKAFEDLKNRYHKQSL